MKRILVLALTDDEKREVEALIKAYREMDSRQDRLPQLFALLRKLHEHHALTPKKSVCENWQLFNTLMVDKGLGWNAALRKASELTGKAENTILKDYAYINKKIPPGLRRETTRKKRTK
jgi:hypothetical protein